MALRDTIDFFLYDWLATPGLTQRDRFADHSRETFDAVLDTCERIAREKYAPFNRTVDIQEPAFDGEKVVKTIAEISTTRATFENLELGTLRMAQYKLLWAEIKALVLKTRSLFGRDGSRFFSQYYFWN